MMFYDFQYMQSARNKNQLILIGCKFASSRNQKGRRFAGARGRVGRQMIEGWGGKRKPPRGHNKSERRERINRM